MTSQTEIQLYIERAQSALQQSKDNLNLGHYDVATSRAYYAMFYAATAMLLSKGIARRKHSGVQSAFGQYFVKPGLIEAEYSRMLGNAFRIRLDSDYEITTLPGQVLAEDSLDNARQFVNRASTYLQNEGYI